MSQHISGKKAILFIALFTFIFGINFYASLVIRPRENKWALALTRLSPEEVKLIKVEPTGNLYSITHSFEFTDKVTIIRIVEGIAEADVVYPSHPRSNWECQLTIETKDQNWIVKLNATDNSGFLAYVDSGATLRNDQGFSDIQNLVLANIKP